MMNNELQQLDEKKTIDALVRLGEPAKAWNNLQWVGERYKQTENNQKKHGLESGDTDLTEIEQEYQEAYKAYEKARNDFIYLIKAAGLTGVQQTIIYLSYITSDTPTFVEIARRAGLKTADKAKNEYEMAFFTIENFLAHSRRFRKRK